MPVVVLMMAGSLLMGNCGGSESPEKSGGVRTSDAVPGTSVVTEESAVTTTPPTTVDPGTLPQTQDKPESSGPEVDAMGRALWDAIVKDDPDRALHTFFPLSAYEQVKDIWNPESDWNGRLVTAFEADVAKLHEQVSDPIDDATFLGMEIPGGQAQWIDPGGEYNKIGYWRVYGSTLVYELDGEEKSLPVYSLISWRGEWYVVHLGPIR